MSVYVVQTQKVKPDITEKEPYKTFLRKYKNAEKEGLNQNEIVFALSRNGIDDGPFKIDGYYFFNPRLKFAFFDIKDEDVEDRLLICHELEFEFEDEVSDTLSRAVSDIKDKQSYFYLPDVEEMEISYNMEYERCILRINVVTEKIEKAMDISMLLLSLDIALMTTAW